MPKPPAKPRPDRAPRRRSSLQRPGFVYAFVTVLVAIGAVNSQNNLLFIIFGLLVGSVLVSGVIGGGGMMGVRVTRALAPGARVGEPVVVRYRLHNRNRVLPAGAIILEESTANREVLPAPPRAFIDLLRADQRRECEAIAIPRRRGRVDFEAFHARSRFPLGLTEKRLRFEAPASLLVRPARVGIAPRPLAAALGLGVAGVTASKRPGAGDEFVALRDYAPGDSTRRIAWRPSARLGHPVIRIPGAPVPRRSWVVLSAVSEDGPDSIERAVAIAGSLVEHWTRQGRETGLIAHGLRVEPSSARPHVDRVLDALALWSPAQSEPQPEGVLNGLSGAVAFVRTRSAAPPPTGALTLEADDPDTFEHHGDDLPEGLRFGVIQEDPVAGRRRRARRTPARAATPRVSEPAP